MQPCAWCLLCRSCVRLSRAMHGSSCDTPRRPSAEGTGSDAAPALCVPGVRGVDRWPILHAVQRHGRLALLQGEPLLAVRGRAAGGPALEGCGYRGRHYRPDHLLEPLQVLGEDQVAAEDVPQGRGHVRAARHARQVQAVCHTRLEPLASRRPQAGLPPQHAWGPRLGRAVTFYQIATKIESVYVLSLPPEVSALLQLFHVAFAINVDSFGLPLGCLSLATFYNKLIFMMIAPLVRSP